MSDTLGHSDTRITRDIYQSALPEVGKSAAEATAKLVPLQRRAEGKKAARKAAKKAQEKGKARAKAKKKAKRKKSTDWGSGARALTHRTRSRPPVMVVTGQGPDVAGVTLPSVEPP
ncbi:hypothetical protein PO587_31140 [Streptomyces gilvifuscus]|uniref:Integrase n=1 Tax=Streptomyces gilvifuscus TaxID=1550617 RepID=A0ABT5G2G5_9ACTN|nr:hypothetical protein [Streptomyces gilvifuscus]MDC2958902.1 hypothetical protein [Streptomyces gilvifuscus]